jgi:hypothetical protein
LTFPYRNGSISSRISCENTQVFSRNRCLSGEGRYVCEERQITLLPAVYGLQHKVKISCFVGFCPIKQDEKEEDMNGIQTNYSKLTQNDWGHIGRIDVLTDEISRKLGLSDPIKESTMAAKITLPTVIYRGKIGKHFLLIEE